MLRPACPGLLAALQPGGRACGGGGGTLALPLPLGIVLHCVACHPATPALPQQPAFPPPLPSIPGSLFRPYAHREGSVQVVRGVVVGVEPRRVPAVRVHVGRGAGDVAEAQAAGAEVPGVAHGDVAGGWVHAHGAYLPPHVHNPRQGWEGAFKVKGTKLTYLWVGGQRRAGGGVWGEGGGAVWGVLTTNRSTVVKGFETLRMQAEPVGQQWRITSASGSAVLAVLFALQLVGLAEQMRVHAFIAVGGNVRGSPDRTSHQ